MSQERSAVALGLEQVHALRAQRAANPDLGARVNAVKCFQHGRFERDYAALLASPRYAAAARFFLNDLYGPVDFSARDAQFSRIVPALRRLLPDEVFHTVEQLVELHALSEELDQAMAHRMAPGAISESAYREAWRSVGRPGDRERQVALVIDLGRALDRHTRKPLLGTTLRLMHGPAHAAGLGDLQAFLQEGFSAFKSMKGAEEFLAIISNHERRWIATLFGEPPHTDEQARGVEGQPR